MTRRTMRLWSPELRANLAAYRGHLFPVWDVAACPGGLYAATASADRTARVWSTERTQSLRILAGADTNRRPARLCAHVLFTGHLSDHRCLLPMPNSRAQVPSRCDWLRLQLASPRYCFQASLFS